MKKIILFLAIVATFTTIGLAQAKKDDDIKSNMANILRSDLKQRVQIDETSAGNMVWLFGAKITEIPGTTTPNLIKVKIFGQDYKVQIATSTNIVGSSGSKSAADLSEFSVGDIVNVYGTLDSADYFLVRAKNIHNVSIQKPYTVVNGKILSIASSTNSFTMEAKKAGTSTLLVNTDSNTKIYAGKTLKSFSDLQVGMKVKIRGIWDRALSKIQALLVRINPTKTEEDDD